MSDSHHVANLPGILRPPPFLERTARCRASRRKRPTTPDYAIDGDAVIRRSHGQPLWTKDGKPLPIERPHAFRCIAGRWFTDGVHVIVQGQLGSAIVRQYYYRIEDADLDTFEVLNQRYARDVRQAYYITGKTIRTHSPHAFRPLVYETWSRPGTGGVAFEMREHEYVAVDDESIYVTGRRVAGAHGASAVGFPGNYFADADRVYYYGRPKDIDRASFVCGPDEAGFVRVTDRFGPIDDGERQTVQDARLVDDDFARDRNHAYIVGYVSLVEIDGADPASFRVAAPGAAQDAIRCYDAKTLRDATAPRD
ncbi:DKNYY domain-containing protein [Burkholderia stagnalis]|uniref:DKNYY domain-containing protein n=1 Tax=Burkholderia stagnalis TaxID=1503054 RepID=UPI001629DF85|nr:DKNYY domain-containing protein [Burkholderia stagnalis]